MKISLEEVKKIAGLASLTFSEKEYEKLSRSLNDILLYIEKLSELDVSRVEPTSHVLDVVNVFRDDIVKPSIPSEDALKNSPDRDGSNFRVPKVIE